MDPFDLRDWTRFAAAGGGLSFPAITDQIAIDSRRIASPNALFVALKGQKEDGHCFIPQAVKAGARFVLAKREWRSHEPLDDKTVILYVDDPLCAFQEIAAAYRKQMPCSVIAIAGSYGKTMVKDLLQEMLKAQYSVAASPESFNSQIGVPLSLLTIRKEHQIALIEAGISHQNEMDRLWEIIAPDYGIVTPIGKKHLPTLGSLQNAASEILKILKFPSEKRWALLPKDPHITCHLDSLSINTHFWSDSLPDLPHAYFTSKGQGTKASFRIDFPDGGKHEGEVTFGFYYFLNLINITTKAAWLMGISSTDIGNTLRRYTPEPMKTEIWQSPTGITFINDTYCSDPQSVDNSLKYLDQAAPQGRKVLVFGGMRGEHSENNYKRVGKAICRANVDRAILFGPHPFQPLIDKLPTTEVSCCHSYPEALHLMQASLKQDDMVVIKGENKYPIDQIIETFNDSICSNQCIINLATIAENLEMIRHKLQPNTRVMVMVKALAYGTDEIRIAKFLETCEINILGVSYVDEGVNLKRAGVSQSIFTVNAAVYEAAKAVKWDLEIGISDKTLIEAVASEAKRQRKKIKVHLHVDTGMNRLGCRPEEALPLARLILGHPFLIFEGIMTHFACSEDPAQDPFTTIQASRFGQVIDDLQSHGIDPPWKHAANSSGAIRFAFPQFNMVRLGLAIYGLCASQATKDALELRLALSLISRIVGINTCKLGDTISYGRSYSIQQEQQTIAVLPIGYFDGLHRSYSGKGVVIIRGQKAPMVGKICMDFMMVDVTNIPDAALGDPVLIFGEDEYGHYLAPEELAANGNSIVHELITCLGPRIQRIFVHEEAHRTH